MVVHTKRAGGRKKNQLVGFKSAADYVCLKHQTGDPITNYLTTAKDAVNKSLLFS